mmetsp:Transcript_13844/g.31394  ORF Transcript_13844/g.31394 Transcript_13844/m.31394 type:complete len:221 (-) Transcript_13844:1182-1844(-)
MVEAAQTSLACQPLHQAPAQSDSGLGWLPCHVAGHAHASHGVNGGSPLVCQSFRFGQKWKLPCPAMGLTQPPLPSQKQPAPPFQPLFWLQPPGLLGEGHVSFVPHVPFQPRTCASPHLPRVSASPSRPFPPSRATVLRSPSASPSQRLARPIHDAFLPAVGAAQRHLLKVLRSQTQRHLGLVRLLVFETDAFDSLCLGSCRAAAVARISDTLLADCGVSP